MLTPLTSNLLPNMKKNLQREKDMCIKIISTLILKLIVPFYNYCPSCQNPLN